MVCSVYHVPPYKVGVGALPTYNNVQALNVEYYSQALQSHIEEIEELLDHALGIGWGVGMGTEFDTDNLLRMDSVTQVTAIQRCGRRRRDVAERGPRQARPQAGRRRRVAVSAAAELFSLAALAKRDAQDDPFAAGQAAGTTAAAGHGRPAAARTGAIAGQGHRSTIHTGTAGRISRGRMMDDNDN